MSLITGLPQETKNYINEIQIAIVSSIKLLYNMEE